METAEQARLMPHTRILKDWWTEVKDNFWEDDAKKHVKTLLKELMENTLREDMREALKQDWQEEEAPYRNGYYSRSLVSQYGLIDGLRVPRLRNARYQTRVFKRYKRYQPAVADLVEDIFLKGISTRKVGDCVQRILDTKVSSSAVSRITQRLSIKAAEFHKRPLLDEYQYLVLDGIVLKVRYGGTYHKRSVLVAYGITLFGKKELLDFRQAKAESKDAWEALLNGLYQRGLKGESLRLLVMDGSPGLKAAAELVYPQAKIQRCWVHKLRNVTERVRKRDRKNVLCGAQKIYLADNRREAIRCFTRWKKHWVKTYPQAVACLQKDLEDLLAFFGCPKEHGIKIRTTNVIERSFREVRRRTRVFSCFSNTDSSERLIFAIFVHLNESWKDKPLAGFTQFN